MISLFGLHSFHHLSYTILTPYDKFVATNNLPFFFFYNICFSTESLLRLLKDNKELVSKADSEQWTPLHYAAYYENDKILDATHVGYKPEEYHSANETWWVPSPLHVAAKQGHTSTLIKLLYMLPLVSLLIETYYT